MKTERFQLRAFVLFLFLVVVLSVSSASFAAVTIQPPVRGYLQTGPTGGYFGSAQNTFNSGMAPSYNSTGTFNVGGKLMTVPAKVPLVANAGSLVKIAMRTNPYLLAGSLALPWLLDQGLEWSADQNAWQKFDPAAPLPEYPDNYKWGHDYTALSCYYPAGGCDLKAALDESAIGWGGAGTTIITYSFKADVDFLHKEYNVQARFSSGQIANTFFRMTRADAFTGTNQADRFPATDSDWDALPDPIPTVGPELPSVGYMPQGAPVNAPTYDFAPYSAPTGEPYKKPDGSTVQPMVTVSPNVTNITYNTYNQTTHNAAGEPVVNAPPSDENADEVKDPCDSHPERAGCAELGTDDFKLEKETVTMVFTPEASPISGSCPAPIALPNGGVLSWEPACNAMVQIKPIVLALAGMMTAFMVIGAMRS